jgi:hypothetical protein
LAIVTNCQAEAIVSQSIARQEGPCLQIP